MFLYILHTTVVFFPITFFVFRTSSLVNDKHPDFLILHSRGPSSQSIFLEELCDWTEKYVRLVDTSRVIVLGWTIRSPVPSCNYIKCTQFKGPVSHLTSHHDLLVWFL